MTSCRHAKYSCVHSSDGKHTNRQSGKPLADVTNSINQKQNPPPTIVPDWAWHKLIYI